MSSRTPKFKSYDLMLALEKVLDALIKKAISALGLYLAEADAGETKYAYDTGTEHSGVMTGVQIRVVQSGGTVTAGDAKILIEVDGEERLNQVLDVLYRLAGNVTKTPTPLSFSVYDDVNKIWVFGINTEIWFKDRLRIGVNNLNPTAGNILRLEVMPVVNIM